MRERDADVERRGDGQDADVGSEISISVPHVAMEIPKAVEVKARAVKALAVEAYF